MPYTIRQPHEGVYEIIDTDPEYGGRVARVALWMPGPMVSVDGERIASPELARVIAEAMLRCARDVESRKAELLADVAEYDGLSCERCGIESASICECDS